MDFFSGGLSFVSIFITVIFVIVIGIYIFVAIKGLTTWFKNSQSPVLTVPAEVVAKRMSTSGESKNSLANTWYHVTFHVQSGNRMELGVTRSEYGMLAEGDLGLLKFQGSRYKRFERNTNT